MDGSQPVTRESIVAETPMSAAPPRAPAPAAPPPRRRRRLLVGVAAVAVLLGAGWYGKYWWTTGRFMESTDDAYTQADAVGIAPRISGYVSEVAVGDNERVHAGQLLARIDPRDYQAALDQARADVASAQADIRNADAQLSLQQATIAQAATDIAAAQAAVSFAEADYRRYTDLAHTGNGTVQRAEQADSDIRQKNAALAHARAAMNAAQQEVGVLNAQKARAEASLARAQAAAEQAQLNLSYTTITAPVDGAVGDRALRLGQYVSPGTRVMDVVPVGRDIYVVANFKETQLAEMWRGERVDISVDMLPGQVLHGRVDSLAPGSGAQFALLPPENATGNFTKVVQRVPVKILLDTQDARVLAKLRPGLSVIATVDVRTAPSGERHTLVAEGDSGPDVASVR
jgi:membrane fusion protein (multidrug efflux system)